MINRISLSRIILLTIAATLIGILVIVFLQIEEGSGKPLSYEVIEQQQERMQEKIQEIQQRNPKIIEPSEPIPYPSPLIPPAPMPPAGATAPPAPLPAPVTDWGHPNQDSLPPPPAGWRNIPPPPPAYGPGHAPGYPAGYPPTTWPRTPGH